MIQRTPSNKILEQAKHYPVIALIGPRQSGKTTLVRDLFREKPYVNLEDGENRDFAERDPKGFLETYPDGAVIDEVQRVPKLLSFIQVIVDETRHNGRYILTGSQNFLLMEGITQSLAGRVALFTLLPLSLLETRKFVPENRNLSETLFLGSYPKALTESGLDISGYYANYTQTYVERDVRLIRNIPDLSAFRSFLVLCAARTGQLLNIASLGNDAGITHATAKQWLSLLEMSFIIFLLRPHHKNYGKRVVKMPKLYFYDTGLLCYLLDITQPSQVSSHYLSGGIFESFVISECLKYRSNFVIEPRYYFWRDKTGNEVDLLMEHAGALTPVEIKFGATISSDYFHGIAQYARISGSDPRKSYVVYGGTQNQIRDTGTVLGWRNFPDTSIFSGC